MKNAPAAFLFMLGLAAPAAFATERPTGPAGIYVDYVDGRSNGVRLTFNPMDLGDEPLSSPLLSLKSGDTVWLGTQDRVIERTCASLTLDERRSRYRGGVSVALRGATPFLSGYVVLSLKPLPEQRWTVVPMSSEDRAFVSDTVKPGRSSAAFPPVRIHSEALGEFLLVNEEQRPGGGPASFRTKLFRSVDGRWEKQSEFTDQGAQALVDIDGDGFPEVAGATGDKSYALRRIYPQVALQAMNTSGV